MTTETKTTETKATGGGLTRRSLMKTGAAAVGAIAGSGAITGFPTIWAQNPITLLTGNGHYTVTGACPFTSDFESRVQRTGD